MTISERKRMARISLDVILAAYFLAILFVGFVVATVLLSLLVGVFWVIGLALSSRPKRGT